MQNLTAETNKEDCLPCKEENYKVPVKNDQLSSEKDCKPGMSCYENIGTISGEMAKLLAQTYQQTISNSETMCSWIGLKRLKSYIACLENTVSECAGLSLENLGMRIYYGRYPANINELRENYIYREDLQEVPEDYANCHNLFIVPTYLFPDGANYDFNPRCLVDNGCVPKSLTDEVTQEAGVGLNKFTRFFILSPGSRALDHVSMIPPKPRTGAAFIFTDTDTPVLGVRSNYKP